MTDSLPGSLLGSLPDKQSSDSLQYPQILLEASFDSLLSHSFPPVEEESTATATTATATTTTTMPVVPPSPPHHRAASLDDSWASISDDAGYSQDDDLQSEVTDADSSLIDLHSTTDEYTDEYTDGQSLRDHDHGPGHDEIQASAVDLRSSSHTRTPGASHFLGSSASTTQHASEITLPEADLSDLSDLSGQSLHAVHTITTFNASDVGRLQLPPSASTTTYLGTLHMTLSKTMLRRDSRTSFRLLLLGPEYTASLRASLVNKIADALVASHPEDQPLFPPSRYHVVPDSFGPGSQPAAAEVIPIAQGLDVDAFHSATKSGEEGSTIILRNEHTMDRAVLSFDYHRAKFVVRNEGWQQPDLAIVVIDTRDSVLAQQSAHSMFLFATRLAIPTILLRMDNDWNADMGPLAFTDTETDACLCIEEQSFSSSTNVVRTLPLDLNTFLNVNAGQLGKHLAYLLSVQRPASPLAGTLTRKTHYLPQAYTTEANAKTKTAFTRIRYATPSRLLVHMIAALAASFLLVQCASFLKLSWAPISPASVPAIVQNGSYSAIGSTSAPISTHLASTLTTSTSVPLASSTLASSRKVTLEAGRFGNSHILLRVSDLPSALSTANIQVRREDEEIKIESHALFPGVYSIRLDSFQAYGHLDVCLNPSKNPSKNPHGAGRGGQQCITVDFEHQPLSAWLKQAIMDFEPRDLATWLRKAVDSGEDQVRKQVEKGVAAWRLSLASVPNLDWARDVIREAQKRVVGLEKTALADIERESRSGWAKVEAWKSQLAGQLKDLHNESRAQVQRAGHQSRAALEAAYRSLHRRFAASRDKDISLEVRVKLTTSQLRARQIVNGLGDGVRAWQRRD